MGPRGKFWSFSIHARPTIRNNDFSGKRSFQSKINAVLETFYETEYHRKLVKFCKISKFAKKFQLTPKIIPQIEIYENFTSNTFLSVD